MVSVTSDSRSFVDGTVSVPPFRLSNISTIPEKCVTNEKLHHLAPFHDSMHPNHLADCRSCGMLICSECSRFMQLPAALGYGGREEVRSCKSCEAERLNVLWTSQRGDEAATECLLRWGMHGKCDESGRNALHTACERGSAAAVKCLTECGFPTCEKDNEGCTALHISAAKGDLYSMKYLIIAGCDRNMSTAQGTPLHAAAQNDQLDAVTYLVNRSIHHVHHMILYEYVRPSYIHRWHQYTKITL